MKNKDSYVHTHNLAKFTHYPLQWPNRTTLLFRSRRTTPLAKKQEMGIAKPNSKNLVDRQPSYNHYH